MLVSDGFVVLVVCDVDCKIFVGIEGFIVDLVKKVCDNKLVLKDL